jgi:hypothetical protein
MTDRNDTAERRGLTAVADELERPRGTSAAHADQGRPTAPAERVSAPPTRVGFDPHNDPRDPQPDQGPSRLGIEAGKAIALACEVAAQDIERTADSLVGMANEISGEARQIAAALRARGARFQDRIEDFSELAKRVSNTMRATGERVMHEQEVSAQRSFAPARA